MQGIDVSENNGYEPLYWHSIKAAGIDFAICRTGFGKGGLDPTFIQNVNGAHDAGLIWRAFLDTIKPLEIGRYKFDGNILYSCAEFVTVDYKVFTKLAVTLKNFRRILRRG